MGRLVGRSGVVIGLEHIPDLAENALKKIKADDVTLLRHTNVIRAESSGRDYPEAGRREKHFDNDVDNQDGRLNFQSDLSHIRGQNGCITIVTGDGREGFIQGSPYDVI